MFIMFIKFINVHYVFHVHHVHHVHHIHHVHQSMFQVATLGGQQLIQSSSGQQFLIVNKALQSSGGRIQIVNQDQPEKTGDIHQHGE